MQRGRKIKLDKETAENFCKGLSLGLTAKGACDYAGISEQTYYTYLKQGREDAEDGKVTIFSDFLESVKRARASFRIYHMSKIREAAESGNWQASAWSLERLFPDEYGKQDKIIVSEVEQNIIDEVEKAVLGK